MHITVEWADPVEKRVILETVTPGWTWTEFVGLTDTVWAMADEVEHPVHIIVDLRNIKKIPPGGLAYFSKLNERSFLDHPNAGYFIFVGGPTFVMGMLRIFQNVFGEKAMKVISVKTMEEAYALVDDYGKKAD